MGHLFKKFFLLETVDIGGALYIYTLGGVFALSLGVVLFYSTKFRQKAQIYENYNRQTYFSYIATFLGMLFLLFFFLLLILLFVIIYEIWIEQELMHIYL